MPFTAVRNFIQVLSSRTLTWISSHVFPWHCYRAWTYLTHCYRAWTCDHWALLQSMRCRILFVIECCRHFLNSSLFLVCSCRHKDRVLLQQVRELLHSQICCHMHREKNIWYFRFQDEKESLRLRVRELTTCVERCKETIGSYKSKLSCLNWEHMVTSLMYRHVSRVFRRLRRFRSFP